MSEPRTRLNLILAFTLINSLMLVLTTAFITQSIAPAEIDSSKVAKADESAKDLYGALTANADAVMAFGQARLTATAAIMQKEAAPAQLVTRFETQMETAVTATDNMLAKLEDLMPALQMQSTILRFKNQFADFHKKSATMKADFTLTADQREFYGHHVIRAFTELTNELILIRRQLDILYPATAADLAAHRRLQTNLALSFENQTRAAVTLLNPVIFQQTFRPPYQNLATLYISRVDLLAEAPQVISDLGILDAGINELLAAEESASNLEQIMFQVSDISDAAAMENPDQNPRDLVVDYGLTVEDFFRLTDKAQADTKYILDLSLLQQTVLLDIKF